MLLCCVSEVNQGLHAVADSRAGAPICIIWVKKYLQSAFSVLAVPPPDLASRVPRDLDAISPHAHTLPVLGHHLHSN